MNIYQAVADRAMQFVEGGECRFGQRQDADRQGERATVSLSDQRQKEWNNWLLGEGPLSRESERFVLMIAAEGI